MHQWPVQEAKAKFSALLDSVCHEGPQLVTRRGVETAVIVPIEQWRRMGGTAPPSLIDRLLAPEPVADLSRSIPSRRRSRVRVRTADLG